MKDFEIKEQEVKQKTIVCKNCNKSDGIAVFMSKLDKDKYIIVCEHCLTAEKVAKEELEQS